LLTWKAVESRPIGNKMATLIPVNCSKCDGTGHTPFRHIEGGKCFRCGGTGKFRISQAEADQLAKEAAINAAQVKADYEAFDANRSIDNVMNVFAFGRVVFTFKANANHGTVNCGDGHARPYHIQGNNVIIPSFVKLAYHVNCQLEADEIEDRMERAEYLVSTLG